MKKKNRFNRTSAKRSSNQTSVTVQEKVTRRYLVPSEDRDDEKEVDTIQVSKRHYCKICKRKRDETFMEVVSRARYGKMSWACVDKITCIKIMKMKRAL